MTCSVNEDGTLKFVDASGNPIDDHTIEVAKKQNREALQGLIQRACDEINDEVSALGRLHLGTPDPRVAPRFDPQPFDEPLPPPPAESKVGFLAGLFASKREAIERANADARAEYQRMHAVWTGRKAAHETEQDRLRERIERVKLADVAAMEAYFAERLESIDWPRETLVAFEVREAGRLLALDVDLPEIEHMPSKVATVPARGLKLSVKDMTAGQLQKLYMGHVHGILFRLIGEAFAALPAIETVTASGYSQRADPATGKVGDEYLLSLRVSRARWLGLDFGNLGAIDVVEALGALGAVRNVQRGGKLAAIQQPA